MIKGDGNTIRTDNYDEFEGKRGEHLKKTLHFIASSLHTRVSTREFSNVLKFISKKSLL